MDISLPRELLSQTWNQAATFTTNKSSFLFYSMVLLTADRDHVSLRGANGFFDATFTIPATVYEPGTIALPATRVQGLLGLMTGDRAMIKTNQRTQVATITAGSDSAAVKGMSGDEFLAPPPVAAVAEYRQSGEALTKALEKVIFAVGTDIARMALTGVYLDCDDTGITLVATDGSTLSVQPLVCTPTGTPTSVIINCPLKAMLSPVENAETVVIKIQPEAVTLELWDQGTHYGTIQIGTLSNAYPNYHAAIPNNPYGLTVDKKDLSRALGASNKFGAISTITIEPEYMRIKTNNPTADSLIDVPAVADALQSIVFNNSRLLTALTHVTELSEIRYNGPETGVSLHDHTTNGLIVVSPMLLAASAEEEASHV